MTPALTVYLVLASGCPLSNRYLPEISEIQSRYQPRGVRFERPSDPASARKLGARVTPQTVVTDALGRVVYRGRIDDRGAAPGIARPPTRHDLREALDALLDGRPVPAPETPVVGCAITFPAPERKGAITFSEQVAAVLFERCASCHRPGGSGPFSVTSYSEAAPRAAAIAQAARSRRMPPWKAEPGPHPFLGENRLDEAAIRLLEAWAADGAREGDPARTPPLPKFADGWELGPPDMVVRAPKPVRIPSASPDQYTCLAIPISTPRVRYVRAFEFRPGNRPATHHALIFVDSRRIARRAGDTYPCFGTPGFLPTAALGGWTPGFGASVYPAGTAVSIRPGADLVLQLHLRASGREETAQPEIALYFTEEAPRRRMVDIALGSRRIDIAPGKRRYVVRDSFTLPVAVEITGIIPHAHYVCREMRGRAVMPSGRVVDLLTIRDWDFDWQRHYRYRDTFVLPAGTRLEMEFVYDNSAANPRNPSRPPRRVVWGPESSDEMAGLHVQAMPVRNEDAEELGQYLWGKLMRETGRGGR